MGCRSTLRGRWTGSVCGCTAWLPFETHSPARPLPLRLNLGIFAAVLVLMALRTAQSLSLSPAWVSFLGEGVDFSGDSGSSPRGPQLLCQPPEIRYPTLCLSFRGTKETPSRVPRSPESNEFPGRRGTFSPLYHLGNCHPIWATCALFMLSPAGFAFVTTMSTVSFLENPGGYKHANAPNSAFANVPSYPRSCMWARNLCQDFFGKGTNLTFFPLKSQGNTTGTCPFAHLLPYLLPSQAQH